jgi:hypothetical protein
MTVTAETTEREAAETPIDGALVLDEVRGFLDWFATFPSEEALDAVTLWAAHTHAYQAWDTTPRLALLSDEPGSGKSTVLRLLSLLCASPEMIIRPTAAVLFRMIEVEHPTMLLDETDQIFGRGGSTGMADLKAVLNSGYLRGATVPRCEKDTFRKWDVFCPVAMAGLGVLPETIMTRAVAIHLVRGRKKAAAFSRREHGALGESIGAALAAWAEQQGQALATTWPPLPDGLTDRPRDVWEPLLTVAEIAGGHWPAKAKAACVKLSGIHADADAALTPGLRLLRDIRAVWTVDADRMYTSDLLDALRAVDGAPWAALFSDQLLAPRMLAQLLGQYHAAPCKVVIGGRGLQGYKLEELTAAFALIP